MPSLTVDEYQYLTEPTQPEQENWGESMFYSMATGFKTQPGLFYDSLDVARESFNSQPQEYKTRTGMQWALGQLHVQRSRLGHQLKQIGGYGIDAGLDQQIIELGQNIQGIESQLSEEDVGFVRDQLETIANLGPFYWEGGKRALDKALKYSMLTGTIAAGVSALIPVPDEPITVPAAALAGARVGAARGFYDFTNEVEGGDLYLSLLDMEIDGQKIPHELASTISNVYGSMAALVEIVNIPGTSALKKAGAEKVLNKTGEKMIARLSRSKAFKKVLQKHALNTVKSGAKETGEEVIQNLLQFEAQEYAKAFMELKDDPSSDITAREFIEATGNVARDASWEEAGKIAWETAKKVGIPMLIVGGLGETPSLGIQALKTDAQIKKYNEISDLWDSMFDDDGMLAEPTTEDAMQYLTDDVVNEFDAITQAAGGESQVSIYLQENGWKGRKIPPRVIQDAINAREDLDNEKPVAITSPRGENIDAHYMNNENVSVRDEGGQRIISKDRTFWTRKQERALLQSSGLIYDADKDAFGLMDEDIDSSESNIKKKGFFAYKAGGVTVFMEPNDTYQTEDFTFNIGTSITGDQYADAVVDASLSESGVSTLEVLDYLSQFATNPQAMQNAVLELAKSNLSHPFFRIARMTNARGHDMLNSDVTVDGVAEVADPVLWNGAVARLGKLLHQAYVYTSRIYAGTKKPDHISDEQAPSYVFKFTKSLSNLQVARLEELMALVGIDRKTFTVFNNLVIFDHLLLDGGISKERFNANMGLLSNLLDTPDKYAGKFKEKMPQYKVQPIWREHTIITREEYDDYIQEADRRSKQLDTTIQAGYERARDRAISEIIREGKNVDEYQGQPIDTDTEEGAPTLDDPSELDRVAPGDTVYMTSMGWEKGDYVGIDGDMVKIQVGKETHEHASGTVTRWAKSLWDRLLNAKIGMSVEDITVYIRRIVDSLRLAVINPETGEVLLSTPGETHQMTAERNGLHWPDLDYDNENGWVDSDGIFYNRPQAHALLRELGNVKNVLTDEVETDGSLEEFDRRYFMQNLTGDSEATKFIGDEKITNYFELGQKPQTITEWQELHEEIADIKRQAREAMVQVRRATNQKQRELGQKRVEKLKQRYRDARERARDIAKNRKYIHKVIQYFTKVKQQLSNPERYKIPEEFATVLRELLDNIDLKKMTKKTQVRLSKTLAFAEQHPEVALPDYVIEQLERLSKIALRDMSIKDIQALETTVTHYMHLAAREKRLIIDKQNKDLDEAHEQALMEMKPIEQMGGEILSSAYGVKDKVSNFFGHVKNFFTLWSWHYDLAIEALAGRHSVAFKILYRQVRAGIHETAMYRRDILRALQEHITGIGKKYEIGNMAQWMEETIITGIPVISKHTGQTRLVSLTRNEIMGLYRHSLNKDNLTAITEGGFALRRKKRGSLIEVFRFVNPKLAIGEILRKIGAAEIELAGAFTNRLMNKIGADMGRIYKMKNGIDLLLEDNYWHKDVVSSELDPIHIDPEKSYLEKWDKRYVRMGVSKGFLKSRKGSKKAIVLGGFDRDLYQSIHNAAAYIGLEIPMSNASKFFYNPKFKVNFQARYGAEYWSVIDKGLRDIAGGHHDKYQDIEDSLMRFRANLSSAILGVSPWIMLKQVVSLPLYAIYINPLYLMKALTSMAFPYSDIEKRIKMFIPEYEERLKTGPSRDIAEIFQASGGEKIWGRKASLRERVTGGIRFFDRSALVPGIEGAAMQVLDELRKGKLSKNVKYVLGIDESIFDQDLSVPEKMRLAYKFGWEVTALTQPMFSVEHRSHLSRGSVIAKMFTMFSSFTNQAYNLVWRTAMHGKRTGDWGPFAKMVVGLFIINPIAIMMINHMRDKFYNRDDDKEKWFDSGIAEYLNNIFGYVYGLRDIASGVIQGFDPDIPATTAMDKIIRSLRKYGDAMFDKDKDGEWMEALDATLESVLMFGGLPYYTPKKIVTSSIEHIEDGDLGFMGDDGDGGYNY